MNNAIFTINKKSQYGWYIYILIGIAFLSSGHVYSVTKGNLCDFLLFAALSYMIIRKIIYKKTIIKKNTVYIFAFITIAFLIDMLMNILFNYSLYYSIRFFSIIVYSYIFTTELNFDSFKKLYVKCMSTISAIAIVGFFIGSFSNFYYSLPTITNVNGISYYDGIIFFGMNDYSRGRNLGIFWEPGIFAIFIAIAILFMLFDSEKINKIQFAILLFALFSTLSTTGYFLMAICLIGLIYIRKKAGITKGILLILSVLFIIIGIINSSAIFSTLLSTFPRVFTKLIDNSSSTTYRMDSIKYNLEIFARSPIFGNGLIRTNILFSELSRGSQTSTMTLYFAQFGLIGIIYVVSFYVAVIKYRTWTKGKIILFCLAWTIMLNVEIVTFFPLIHIISFYFIKESLFNSQYLKQET